MSGQAGGEQPIPGPLADLFRLGDHRLVPLNGLHPRASRPNSAQPRQLRTQLRGAPLRVVARQAGYGSEIAFAAAFKREYGVSPGRYRRHADSEGR